MADEPKRTDIASIGEFGLIDRLTGGLPTFHPHTIKAVGDDAAVIDHGDHLSVISTDMMVEGIHFDMVYTPLRHLGYKAVIINLSDIYAMNAVPEQITFSMAISNRFSVEAIEELYEGVKKACELYKVDLVGGDTTSSNRGLILSVTAIGRTTSDQISYRHTAKPGDLVCISGNLGAAYLGLQILEREKQVFLSNPNAQPEMDDKPYLLERQLKPEARADVIDNFRKKGIVPTSMIDVSDGLSSELFHIARSSGVGAFIEESGVPIHPDAQMQAVTFGLDPISCALSGGEDYELLFTVHPDDVEKIRFLPDIYIAGEITAASEGVKLHTKGGKIHDITAQGWRHFDPNTISND